MWGAGTFWSRLFTVVTFVGVLVAGSAWFTQCQPAARNVSVGGAKVSCPDRPFPPLLVTPATVKTFVPGSPIGLLACRFHGLNQPQPSGSFAAAATFRPAAFVTALNSARRVASGPALSCPVDLGERIVLQFVYADRHVLTVVVASSGCRFADNGDHRVFTPQSVLSTLKATLGHDELPTA